MLGWNDTRPLGSILDQSQARAFSRHFGFKRAQDLLEHFPRGYAAQGVGLGAGQAEEGDTVTLVGEVVHNTTRSNPKVGKVYTIWIDDGTGIHTTASFFRATWQPKVLHNGTRAIFSGKLKFFRGQPQLQHPDFFPLGKLEVAKEGHDGSKYAVMQLLLHLPYVPIYPAKQALPSWKILGAIDQVLKSLEPIPDPLGKFAPPDLPDFDQALRGIHEPPSQGPDLCRKRLNYDEALSLGLLMALRRADTQARKAPAMRSEASGYAKALRAALDFSLTKGQEAVLADIRADLSISTPMQRLLQGEVGSGKTVVALLAMLQCVDSGAQCALLAPTEVLATQHAQSIEAMLKGIDVNVTLLTGSMNTRQRQAALLDILSGDADIVIGTHALIQDTVEFFNLGLCVVDEQHRFGVEQRDTLRGKGREGLTPHLLVMTATPIPRTIAMTAFGDLSVSTLRELPGGRQPISSYVIPAGNQVWVARMWERLKEECRAGHQVYVVCPKIGGEDGVEALAAELQSHTMRDFRIAVLHGQLSSEDKAHAMAEFSAGKIDVLVATTVIEVGVDVANATAMLIYGAESFGVSQLHQLRGRVGRGGNASICFFYTHAEPGSRTLERVGRVASTQDGFELAEVDLEFRQEGNILGAQQSGRSHLRLLSLSKDRELIARANSDAAIIVEEDPKLARALVQDIDDQRQAYIDKS
ncbi:ATP-dependent DNA helicase RecG [Corynebacterium pseudopelargi]|nr:ATP-dependent DNA helicase RecG [Corynebacterium pseudopelargi]